MQWCDDTQTEFSYSIKSGTAKIEDTTATITDNGAQIAALVEELEELGTEIATQTAEMEKAIAIREKEHEIFLKSEAEQVEAAKQAKLAKLQRALTIMVDTFWLDPGSKKNLAELQHNNSFVQEEPAPAGDAMAAQVAQNEANLAAFEELKGKAEEALQKQRDEETKAQSEHDIQVMSLKQAIALAEDNVDDAKKERARLAEEKAKCEEEKADAEAAKAADEKSLEETTQECEATSAAWATRQKEAAAEMAASEKAKEILASRVTGLLQVKTADKMPDEDSSAVKTRKTRQHLINHFRTIGNKLHSMAMLNLVTVSAQDPMENVKNLLTELIAKLEKEAKEAADLHAFCQAEKKKTKAAMDKKNMEIDKLSTRIEKATATKQEQEELIASNSEEIASIEKANAEATKLRNEQNANFVKIDTDFTGAAEAVDDAIDALKEYY